MIFSPETQGRQKNAIYTVYNLNFFRFYVCGFHSAYKKQGSGDLTKGKKKKKVDMPTQLTQEEIDSCRDAFLQYDKDRSGSIDQWELKEVLEGKFFF